MARKYVKWTDAQRREHSRIRNDVARTRREAEAVAAQKVRDENAAMARVQQSLQNQLVARLPGRPFVRETFPKKQKQISKGDELLLLKDEEFQKYYVHKAVAEGELCVLCQDALTKFSSVAWPCGHCMHSRCKDLYRAKFMKPDMCPSCKREIVTWIDA